MNIKYHFVVLLRYIKALAIVRRNNQTVARRKGHIQYTPETPIKTTKEGITVKSNRYTARVKATWEIKIRRNGLIIQRIQRERDLHVWRGQSIFAYLLSQGAVGTNTASWKVVASENSNMPDMGDDSGEPETNEFSPLIGTPIDATYTFYPTVKPSGAYQTYAELVIKGTVISDGSKTLRKIGIIDTVATPNRHIIFEDSVIAYGVILNDEIEVTYTVQMG